MSLELETKPLNAEARVEGVTRATSHEPLVIHRRPGAWGQRVLTGAVLAWFAILILAPTLALVRGAFAGGLEPFWTAVTSTGAQRAFRLTLGITLVATAVNTVFGLVFAIVLVRQRFWGKALVDGLVDLP